MPENNRRSDYFRDRPDLYHGHYPPTFLREVDRVDAQHRDRIEAMEEPDAVTIVGTYVLTVRQPVWWLDPVLRQQAQVAAEHRARCREMAARV